MSRWASVQTRGVPIAVVLVVSAHSDDAATVIPCRIDVVVVRYGSSAASYVRDATRIISICSGVVVQGGGICAAQHCRYTRTVRNYSGNKPHINVVGHIPAHGGTGAHTARIVSVLVSRVTKATLIRGGALDSNVIAPSFRMEVDTEIVSTKIQLRRVVEASAFSNIDADILGT